MWQKNFVRDYGAEVPLYGFASPPLVDGDRLIVMVGGEGQVVMALDRHTGRELWKAGTASEPGYCAPLIRTLAASGNLSSGTGMAWWDWSPSRVRNCGRFRTAITVGMAISTPAIAGNRLAVSSQYEGVLMLEFQPGAAEPTVLWTGFGEHGAGTTMEEGRFQHDHEHGAVARRSRLRRVALR